MNTNQIKPPSVRLTQVDPSWVDAYGHMNMAHYVRLFDELGHQILSEYSLGENYTRTYSNGLFTVQADISYLKEVRALDPLIIELKIDRADDKRLWTTLEMRHGERGYIAAMMKQLAVNVSLKTRRVVPFPAELDGIFSAFRSTE